MTPDPLDDLLAARPSRPDPARRDRHLAAADRVLARRRWLTRARTGLVFAGVAAVGLGLIAMTVPAPKSAPPAPEPEAHGVPPSPPSPAEPEELTAAALEALAEQASSDAESARAYLRAGDRYAAEDNLPAALRCYRNHLDAASADGWEVRVDDHWLLMTLKTARRKERPNALVHTAPDGVPARQ
jgi:hypothetical protein